MTAREKLIVGSRSTTFVEAREKMMQHKIEKLPLVDESDVIIGLITADDIKNLTEYPLANIDLSGRLMVGGSVGVHGDYLERAQELVKAGVDVLVVDIAHGHSEMMFKALKNLREKCGDAQIIAGNIATADGARDLCEAGVDAVKVGVGPGTICITRLVTGCGVPQLTAVLEVAEVAKKYGVPVIADGGVQKSGDIVKALGAGADSVMLRATRRHQESGRNNVRGDKNIGAGRASFAVLSAGKPQQEENLSEVVPEGVESVVRQRAGGSLVGQLVGGLKSE